MNLLFGGPGTGPDVNALMIILVVCASVGLLFTALRTESKAAVPESAAQTQVSNA
ncbi:hypothetical protein LJK87_31555 [Paenibacillus sp. P25]|nr:hypothetical protein LJK87_31555 [Paenibacillus sp. P25]